jgi:Mn-dependent DtxR family transcriptional regulator
LGPDFFVNPVDICGLIRDGSLILAEANRLEVNMAPAQKRLVLTRAEAACLGALRGRELLKSEIAIATKLDLVTIARELHRLAHLGLARKDQNRKWHVSARGKTCRFETAPDRPRRNGAMLGPGAKRLLDMLDGPMRQRVIAEKLEVSQQRAHHLIVKLHALGQVHFADPARPSWLVMKAGDKTPFLSRDAERVLSVLADDYATDLKKISVAVRMSAGKVKGILQELIVQSLVKAVQGLDSSPTYQITSAGLEHPQRVPDRTRAKAPRLPVESDRVRVVLSTIRDNGSLRIRDATERLRIPHQSLNALFQYLKRKQLIAKVHDDLHAPYSLTDDGRATLTEMIRRAA